MTKPIQYITTAIVYPNNRIHVGFGWECIGADWLTRTYQMRGYPTFFSTGMDEHSLKVQRAAEAKNMEPKAYCDQMATDIQKVIDMMQVKYDRFIRTSDEDHHEVVNQLIQKCFDQGDIYQAKYEGYYSEVTETFYTEKELVDGLCPVSKTKPKWISEDNYFFKLSKYEKPLLELFEKNPSFLEPEIRRNEVVSFIKQGLKDFSISRSNFTWGIPLPFEKSHVIYVWFDALINYLTAAGLKFKLSDESSDEARSFDAKWSSAFHIIGKDISRFHCIYWPAMLMSMGIELPKRVFAHGFLNIKGEKISKSLGNIVTPDDVMKVTGVDAFRYYLLGENDFAGDGNFSWESLVNKANADLANDWGNLVNRTISMTRKYFPDEKISVPSELKVSQEIKASFEKLVSDLEAAHERVSPLDYIKACNQRSRELNLYIDQHKPWKLAKQEDQKDQLKEVLSVVMEGIRFIATGLLSICPDRMHLVYEQLGIERINQVDAFSKLEWGSVTFDPIKPSPIYPRLEMPELE